MNYYKRHIGDYAKKAGHLSMLEHGAYTLLLDRYYDREQAPTRTEAIRQCGARSVQEVAAVDAVLADFFTERDGRFMQSRVEEEFVKAEQQARANQANGILGGRPRKAKGKRTVTEPLSDGKGSESEKNPNPLIHQSTNPLTQKKDQERVRGTRLPPDWSPTAEQFAWAKAERPDLDAKRETDNFYDYWLAKAGADAAKLDWNRTWKKWIRSASVRLGVNQASIPASPRLGPSPAKIETQETRAQARKDWEAQMANMGVQL